MLNLTHLSCCKPVSGSIRAPSYRSVHNCFIKLAHKSFSVQPCKYVPVLVHNCSIYNSSVSASNECVHLSSNSTICKPSVSLISKFTINVFRKGFNVVLNSLSVSAVSAPPVNVVNVTTSSTYQCSNLVSKHAVMRKFVLSSSNVNIPYAPAVVTLNFYLPLHVCDVPVPEN